MRQRPGFPGKKSIQSRIPIQSPRGFRPRSPSGFAEKRELAVGLSSSMSLRNKSKENRKEQAPGRSEMTAKEPKNLLASLAPRVGSS